jgi:hypothetical protein
MIWTTLITLILVLARWVIAIQLTRVGVRQKLPNLLWLAAFFYITGIGDVCLTLSMLAHLNLFWVFKTGVGLSEIVMVMFISLTFYRDRRSPMLIFMAIAIASALVDVFYNRVNFFSPFNWLWLIVVGYQAYRQVAADKVVEDWVKGRYLLGVAYAGVALAGAPLFNMVSMVGLVVPAAWAWSHSADFLSVQRPVVQGLTIVGIVLEYLVWVMPEAFRRFLNRKYQAPTPAAALGMSEEEVMRQFS